MVEDYGVQLTTEEETRVDKICGKIRKRVATPPRERFDAIYRGESPGRIPIQVCAISLHAASTYGGHSNKTAVKYDLTLRYGFSSNLIVHGPTDRIRDEVKRPIREGWPVGRFVLATDGLDINTPAEHLDVFMKAAKEYGKLPQKEGQTCQQRKRRRKRTTKHPAGSF
ncbi:MAG: hypothetical protein FP814_04945 [Desulfobacterium sp.]|nr:hypothetical protein [Desulfobacterium sp.]MBU3946949.1 hypothetical protein [Pseudomonadota bacterium]MBU4035618.1 hypothetical protein [Pseudomonadota bacterium]